MGFIQRVRRAQVMSTDAIIATVIFLIVVILTVILVSDLFEAPIDLELRTESQKITQEVASGISQGAFLIGAEMQPEQIEQLLATPYYDLKRIYGTQYDFCIYFEDQEGNLIMINETSAGLGDPSVMIGGQPCGFVPSNASFCDKDRDTYYAKSNVCGGTDCNDESAFIHPGAGEICNGQDDDCDLIVDESCVSCEDKDGDGASITGGSCGTLDCDDDNPASFTGNSEVCGDGVDQDCSGADEPCAAISVPVLTCTWQSVCDANTQITLLKASGQQNAHASSYALTPYPYSICCETTAGTLGNDCVAQNATTVARLSSIANAHVQFAGSYPVSACLSAIGSKPSCRIRQTVCAPDEACLFSLSADSNAMMGYCGTYANHVCCKLE